MTMFNKPRKTDLDAAIAHCKDVISKMDNCPCKDDHKMLLYFLEELKFRRELDKELPWEITEIFDRFMVEYFYVKPNRERIANYDWSCFMNDDLLHYEHREFSPRQMFALKCFGWVSLVAILFLTLLIIF